MEKLKNIWSKLKNVRREKLIIVICAIIALPTVIVSSILLVSATVKDEDEGDQTEAYETLSDTQYIPYSPSSPKSLQYQSLGNGTCVIVSIGRFTGDELEIPERSPDGETVIGIGSNAFEGCEELISVSIPSTVSSIGESVFKGCIALVNISVDRSNGKFSSSGGILYSKSKDVLICYPASRIGDTYLLNPNVKTISDNAFFGVKNLTKVNYEGSTSDFSGITIGEGNKVFTSLPITCNYSPAK